MIDSLTSAFLLAWSAPAAFGFFAAWWAGQRGRNPWLWFAFGVLLMPLAGVVLLMLDRDRPAPGGHDLGHLVATNKDLP